MKKWKYLFIVAVILYCAYALIPTVQYYSMSAEARADLAPEQKAKFLDSAIKLGLDLQGGMHLVLEVDDSDLPENAKRDLLDRVLTVIRNRVDQFGVAEPVIHKQGDKRIIVQLPGLQDAERAKELIGKTALLEFRLVREGQDLVRAIDALDVALKGIKVIGQSLDSTGVDVVVPDTTAVDAATADTTSAVPGPEANPFASAFDSLLPTLPDQASPVEVPFSADPDSPFKSYIVTAFLGGVVIEERNREAVELLLNTPQAQRAISRRDTLLWDREVRPFDDGRRGLVLYLLEKKATLTGRMLVDAGTQPGSDDPTAFEVSFELNREGALIFSRWTGENVGRQIAIVLDQRVYSAPTVQTKIPGGQGRITGRFTDEEANDLAIVLRAGALPAPVEIKEERTVGPTLGRDSIVLGVRAALIGFALVLIFMLIYYKFSGVLACMALMLNLAIVLGALAELHAALTLPGIAGLILTIGMAVDANVLIFERIREELAKAKTVRSAIDSGYERAFTTIFDANLTTLITAFVLYSFGTGPIKGFATVLIIGIIASMFTALLCTRVVFELITARRALKKLSI
jgi:protein-export membrane protein SecD